MSKRHMLKFETRHQPLLPRQQFLGRIASTFAISSGLIGASLLAGMSGYHYFEGMPWIDSFANASMILSGMGPLDPVKTWGGKFFAGRYALYSGLLLIVVIGIIVAPLMHRMLHKFHVGVDDER